MHLLVNVSVCRCALVPTSRPVNSLLCTVSIIHHIMMPQPTGTN